MEIHLKNAIFSCCLKLVINSPTFSLSFFLSFIIYLLIFPDSLNSRDSSLILWDFGILFYFQMYYFFLKYFSWKRSQGNGIWPPTRANPLGQNFETMRSKNDVNKLIPCKQTLHLLKYLFIMNKREYILCLTRSAWLDMLKCAYDASKPVYQV